MSAIRRAFLLVAALLGLRPSVGSSQGFRLNLPLPPEPRNAAALAERAVAAAKSVDGITLDYTPDSLALVDKIILDFRNEGQTQEHVGSVVFTLGCYVGEVFVKTGRAAWSMPNEEERRVGFSTMGLRTTDGQFLNPIGKVFKLLRNGSEDSVLYFYRSSAKN